MLLACLAVGLISCRDTIDPREARSPSQVQRQEASGPVTVLNLTCTLSFPDGQKGDVRCGESGAGKKGVSQNVILPWYSAYAVWLPFNLVKDTTTETWTFIASVKNLLGQPIGTLDGTTAVGTKVFITYGPVASQGSGDVWITNADGTGNFTAPDQKYFNYPWITQPQATSPYREWKTHVPNTVTEVTMGVAISTDFPAEQSVASTPPDTAPAWLSADSSAADPTSAIGHEFTKNAAIVMFTDSSTLADRQLAVALVGGKVIGGRRANSGSGAYYLWLPDDGTGAQIRAATNELKALPQVILAMPMIHLSEMYLRPNDQGDWQASKWRLNPANANTGDERWALEEVEAPMAWGCSVGDPTTVIGVLDHGFHRQNIPDLYALPMASYAIDPADTGQHADHVASVIAAEGNNNAKMTGIMWHSAFDIEDPRLTTTGKLQTLTPDGFYGALLRLIQRHVPVINISWGIPYTQKVNGQTVYRRPGTSAFPNDSTDAADWGFFIRLFLKRDVTGPLPVLVIAAGNFPYQGANGTVNSWWSGLPILRDSFPDNVIVVGASTNSRSVANFSGNNIDEPNRASHHYVEIMAPGDSVYVLDRKNNVVARSGTSLSAPMVTGMAGLLLSFDPQLGSSPDELKRLILDGADSSWDAAGANDPARHVVGNGGPYRLLNAYEALKLAAERPGAPLCGNHVWLVGNADYDTVVVQRGAGATEKIWSDPEGALAILNVKHGGHRISYSGPTEDGAIAYNPLTRQWQMESPVDSLPPAIDGGTFNSFWWSSHSGDSSVVVNHAVQRSPTVVVNLFDSHTLTSKPLATVPTAILNSFDSTCVGRKIADNSCSSMTWTGEQQEAYLLAAYSPMGDSAIISVSRIGTVRTLIPEWFPCGSQDSTGTYDHECRNVSQAERSIDTKFYTIPTSTVTSNPSVSWTMAGDRVTQLVITEDGSEVGIGHGAIDRPAMPDFSNCGITYRNLRTGQESPVIPSEPACIYFGAVTASPLRRSPITLNYRE